MAFHTQFLILLSRHKNVNASIKFIGWAWSEKIGPMLIWNACAAKIELSSASTGWVRRQTSGAFAGRPAVGVFRSAIGGRGVRVTIIRVRWGAKEKFLAGAAAFGSAPPRINRTVAARTHRSKSGRSRRESRIAGGV
jgi:hypothetical protein